MAPLKRVLIVVAWAFFVVGLGWIFFGIPLLPVSDCSIRERFGCGLLDIGLSGVAATFVNGAAKFVVATLFVGAWAVMMRLARGRWPKWPFDPK